MPLLRIIAIRSDGFLNIYSVPLTGFATSTCLGRVSAFGMYERRPKRANPSQTWIECKGCLNPRFKLWSVIP